MGRARRPLLQLEEPSAEAGHFGCPMLVRGHVDPVAGQPPLMRCALAWALHNADEVARCAATAALTDCWKVHPERLTVIDPMPEAGVIEATTDAPPELGDEPEARIADD